MNIKFGCDPEVFLFDTIKGQYMSAAGLFPGTKHEPYRVDCGAVQVDGMALEFNIDPVENEKDFVSNIERVKEQMTKMVTEVNKDWVIHYTPAVRFSKDVWDSTPESAKELGCDPDFNFEGSVNENPIDRLIGMNQTLRTGSGHIHIGWTSGQDVDSPSAREDARFVANGFYQAMVFESNRIFKQHATDGLRRAFYGGFGSHRPKSYGVELRAPSNYWVRDRDNIQNMFRTVDREFKRITA